MAHHSRTNIRPSAANATATPTAATHGSQTILQTNANNTPPSVTLRLRAEPPSSRHIRWSEDVVDNEGMGKKSSKVCCIYHAAHEPEDSESDDSSSSSSDDSEPDLSRAQRAGGSNGKNQEKGKGKAKSKNGRRPSPNAYERQPKQKNNQAG